MFSLRVPVATYRLQFNRQFCFRHAQELVAYLHRLGISDLYASPIFKARRGSQHGYDITDPLHLNPELGSEADFETLVQKLKQNQMGLLLDIVPNHMATSSENPWWMDVLENGRCSPYAPFFDIYWDSSRNTAENRVVLPILAGPYEQALENQEFTLALEDTGLSVCYHSYKLPVDIKSYALVCAYRRETLEAALGSDNPSFQQFNQLMDTFERLSSSTSLDYRKAREQYQERQSIKQAFQNMVNTSTKIKTFLLQNIAIFNGKKGDRGSFYLLDKLLEQQVYRLAFWKTAREQLNYRRFFDINDLIGIRVEEPEVLEATHALILQLIQEEKVTGLRIDHIDGLYDPVQYLSRLQHHIALEAKEPDRPTGFYLIVEKILAGDQSLPLEWQTCGTTGYDFIKMVNALFIDSKGLASIDATQSRLTGLKTVFDDVVYEKKNQVIKELFPSEIRILENYLSQLAQHDHTAATIASRELKQVLIEVTACLPVYRTYTQTLEVSDRDQSYLEHAFKEARRRNPAMEVAALDFLRRLLFLDFPNYLTLEQKETGLHFVMRWQQFTGAVMAKGFEDTALYTYNRLISLNEVGGDPGSVSLSIDEFHRYNLNRQLHWPYTLNATSTHDTKRSEDVRARINVLSEIPEEWDRHLSLWSEWNQSKKQRINGLLVPELSIEIFLYQTLIGTWPLHKEEVPEFKQRLKAYIVKVAREAKTFTNWLSPNLDYEDALITFLASILERFKQNDFLEDFLIFEKQIAYYGALNSLAQVLLKITSPGIPDFFQGTELWNLSLVDPDNRRPVDFKQRRELLDDLIQQETMGRQSLIQQVLNSWEDGRVKLYSTYKALNARIYYRDAFLDGQYLPLKAAGQRQEHVVAFIRHKGGKWLLVVIPRLLTKLVNVGTIPVGREVWGDDLLVLPEEVPEHWLNIFTGEKLTVSSARNILPLYTILSTFPVALLKSM